MSNFIDREDVRSQWLSRKYELVEFNIKNPGYYLSVYLDKEKYP